MEVETEVVWMHCYSTVYKIIKWILKHQLKGHAVKWLKENSVSVMNEGN